MNLGSVQFGAEVLLLMMIGVWNGYIRMTIQKEEGRKEGRKMPLLDTVYQ